MPITKPFEMTIENAYEYAYSPEMLDTHKPMEFRLKGGKVWYSEIEIYDYARKHPFQLSRETENYHRIIRIVPSDTIVQIRMKKADSHE